MDTSKIIPYDRHCEEHKRRGNPAFPSFLDVGGTYIKLPPEGNRFHEAF